MPRIIPITLTIWPLSVSPGRRDTLRGILSPAERERAANMRPEVAREFIAGRGVARELLGSICDLAPEAVTFRTEPRGKPHLDGVRSAPAFNISHSGGYCVLAVGEAARIGVDIEAVRTAIDDLATNIFSPRELALYNAIPAADRTRAFFRSWVAKEAYLKATGDGLAGGLRSLEVEPTTDALIRPIAIGGDLSAPRTWQFQGFDVTDGIVGAIAIDAGPGAVDVRLRHVDPEEPGSIAP